MAERLQPPVQHPLWLALLGRDKADGVLGQPRRERVGFDISDEAPLVFLIGEGFDFGGFGSHGYCLTKRKNGSPGENARLQAESRNHTAADCTNQPGFATSEKRHTSTDSRA